MKIVYAVTAHGLGHWTRSAAIINALDEALPEVEWVVSGAVPERVVARDLMVGYRQRWQSYEPGVAQGTSLEMNEAKTREAYVRFFEERAARLDDEIRFLKETGPDAVLADIPALVVRAASTLGLPAIGLANFTWDWILEPIFSGTSQAWMIDALADDYATGVHHIRLPFGPETSPFPRSELAPLVSRRARLARTQVRRALELPFDDGRKLVLVCLGGWDSQNWPDVFVPDCEEYRFITVNNPPITFQAPSATVYYELPPPLHFPDLVAASDLVVAKPGYGLASECAIHRTPMVAVERPRFRETPILLAELERLGPLGHLSLEDFFAGRWQPALDELTRSTAAWADIPTDGAHQVAARIVDLLGA